ncbi:MAG TPA: HAD-IC family P-type ATPase, partial [Burkholderiaceae bacterium]|nr:HAD-IC family P-type ATPase [Burkholderiaceae bacterium]
MEDADHPGLSGAQARDRLARDGPNALPVSQPRSVLRLLGDVAAEPMFLLLVACGGIYMALGDRHEALMLLGFVFVVMAITFVQQRRTERSLDALRDLSSPQALVLRDGRPHRVSSRELVCGDVVLLAEGERVPADLHLLQAANLAVDESMLTGESEPVNKRAGMPGQAFGADQCAHSGTLVTQGTARGLVAATGARSTLGRIGQSLAALGAEPTPIQQEMHRIVKRVAAVGLALAAALALAHGLG